MNTALVSTYPYKALIQRKLRGHILILVIDGGISDMEQSCFAGASSVCGGICNHVWSDVRGGLDVGGANDGIFGVFNGVINGFNNGAIGGAIDGVIHGVSSVIHGVSGVIHGVGSIINSVIGVIHGVSSVIHGIIDGAVDGAGYSSSGCSSGGCGSIRARLMRTQRFLRINNMNFKIRVISLVFQRGLELCNEDKSLFVTPSHYIRQ